MLFVHSSFSHTSLSICFHRYNPSKTVQVHDSTSLPFFSSAILYLNFIHTFNLSVSIGTSSATAVRSANPTPTSTVGYTCTTVAGESIRVTSSTTSVFEPNKLPGWTEPENGHFHWWWGRLGQSGHQCVHCQCNTGSNYTTASCTTGKKNLDCRFPRI